MLAFLSIFAGALYAPRSQLGLKGDTQAVLKTFSQQVDHNNKGKTFNQRYYELTTHVKGEPKSVILFIGGESDHFGPRGETDFTAELAEEFNSIVLVLEHRFFGESFPTDDLSADNLKLLTVEQAVDDLQYFKVEYAKANKLSADCKWILIGGSYPGLLSAYTRAKYPTHFAAALASSGVVYASNSYSDFDRQIAISMGQQCASVARRVRLHVDELLKDDASADWLLKQFNCSKLEKRNFPLVLGEIFSLAPQYGQRAKVCGPLEDTLVTGADPLMALAKFSREVFEPDYADGSIETTYSDAALKNTAAPNGPRAWLWMTCNELAYWQVHSGRLSLRSHSVDEDFFLNQCRNVFDNQMEKPDTDAFNEKWHKLLADTDKVYYTTGSQDPWTPVCFTEEDVPNAGAVAHVISGPEVGHCTDLHAPKATDPADLVRTRAHIKQMLARWIADE